MKHKTNYWYAAAAFFCTVTVLLSLLPSAVFADYPSQEEGEEIVEEVPSNEGKLIIGNADGSAGENEGKRIVLSTAEDFQAFSLNCRNNVWSIGLTVYLDADIDFEGRFHRQAFQIISFQRFHHGCVILSAGNIGFFDHC